MADEELQLIDIEQVILQKNAGLHKLLPGFMIKLITRIIHQDEINYALMEFKGYQGVDFINKVLDHFCVKYTVYGTENILTGKKYVFAANHPLGGLEGMVLASIIGNISGKVMLPVNDILLNLRNLQSIFFPVNKFGINSREAIKKYNEIYRSEYQIIMFPAGLVSRKIRSVVKDVFWEKSFFKNAIEHNREVVPVYVKARNSGFFYFVANVRKLLGLKANIEMFFLPHEMFSRKKIPFEIFFGKPISPAEFGTFKNLDLWADKLREYVYLLDNKNIMPFGKYAGIPVK